jgi:hypothetical protein
MEIRKFAQDISNKTQVQNKPETSGQVVTPAKLNDKAISILTDRIRDEYTAHYFYRSAANWCKNVNYKKAAEFFENEAVIEYSDLLNALILVNHEDKFQVLYFEQTYF